MGSNQKVNRAKIRLVPWPASLQPWLPPVHIYGLVEALLKRLNSRKFTNDLKTQ